MSNIQRTRNRRRTIAPQTTTEFMQGVTGLLSRDDKQRSIGSAVAYVKRNLPRKNFEPHIELLIEYLKVSDELTLFCLDYFGRTSGEMTESDKALVRRMVIICRRKCTFPLAENRPVLSSPPDDQEAELIEAWITGSKEQILDAKWCRAAVVSLLTLDEGISESILSMLKTLIVAIVPSKNKRSAKLTNKARFNSSREYQKFIKRISAVFIADKLPLPRLALYRDITEPILRLLRQREIDSSKVSSLLAAKSQDFEETSKQIGFLESERQELLHKVAILEGSVEELRKSLDAETEKLHRMREWWENKSDSEKKAHLNSFKRSLQHEISEAVISLDDNEPNVPMALNRLKRIQRLISDREDTQP